MTRHIVIDPITRLEGHGKIDVILNDQGEVDRAYFQVPELRGFEKFAQGRRAEDMPLRLDDARASSPCPRPQPQQQAA